MRWFKGEQLGVGFRLTVGVVRGINEWVVWEGETKFLVKGRKNARYKCTHTNTYRQRYLHTKCEHTLILDIKKIKFPFAHPITLKNKILVKASKNFRISCYLIH